jgi:hypothetical protein
MIQQIVLLLAALLSWCVDFFTATGDKKHHRKLRAILLVVVIVAGILAIYDTRIKERENKELAARVADLARKPDLVLVANGREVTTLHPIPCTSSGGIYTLSFDLFNRSDRAASNSTLTVILPDDLIVLNPHEWRRMTGSSVPSPEQTTRNFHLRNYYQRQLAGPLFPQSIEFVGKIVFSRNGEKAVTRSVFADINSLENGQRRVAFDIAMKE